MDDDDNNNNDIHSDFTTRSTFLGQAKISSGTNYVNCLYIHTNPTCLFSLMRMPSPNDDVAPPWPPPSLSPVHHHCQSKPPRTFLPKSFFKLRHYRPLGIPAQKYKS
eukprot:8347741-Ditylum_brightwellii.AAC.2